jgi:23S rRNA (guanosine2251-2'-O)-methyltransferase
MQIEKTFIYGKHPVWEALKERPDVVKEVFLEDGNGDDGIFQLLKESGVRISTFTSKTMPSSVSKEAVHQGVIAEINVSKLVHSFDDYIENTQITDDTAFVILGEVNDPHNVGAVIRSAAAFGISAVMIPEHRQVQVNGTVIKTSAGMAFKIPLISIGNVNQTINDLKDKGCWIYGLDGEAETDVKNEGFERASVFVLGNEGKGIRQKTAEKCDILLKIPMQEGIESLNASVAAGIMFYAWKTKHC